MLFSHTADRRDDINQLKVDLNTEIGLMEQETADLAVDFSYILSMDHAYPDQSLDSLDNN